MNIEHDKHGNIIACFKCDEPYWSAVLRGDKRTEVRWLDRHELLLVESPTTELSAKYVLLTNEIGLTLLFPIAFYARIGKVLGQTLVIFCWRNAPTGNQLGDSVAYHTEEKMNRYRVVILDEHGNPFIQYRWGNSSEQVMKEAKESVPWWHTVVSVENVPLRCTRLWPKESTT